jgi:hypothetical protein
MLQTHLNAIRPGGCALNFAAYLKHTRFAKADVHAGQLLTGRNRDFGGGSFVAHTGVEGRHIPERAFAVFGFADRRRRTVHRAAMLRPQQITAGRQTREPKLTDIVGGHAHHSHRLASARCPAKHLNHGVWNRFTVLVDNLARNDSLRHKLEVYVREALPRLDH